MKPNEEVVWIETYTGKHVNPLELKPEDIDIKDIAHALPLLCRFVGHCKRFYSVAQHSIHVADLIAGELKKVAPMESSDKDFVHYLIESNRTCLAALLHDGAETYMSDVSRPVKHSIKGFIEIENRINGVIMQKFGCIGADWALIKKYDNVMLATEAVRLMPSCGEGWYLPESPISADIPELSPREVEELFIERFFRYGGK